MDIHYCMFEHCNQCEADISRILDHGGGGGFWDMTFLMGALIWPVIAMNTHTDG